MTDVLVFIAEIGIFCGILAFGGWIAELIEGFVGDEEKREEGLW